MDPVPETGADPRETTVEVTGHGPGEGTADDLRELAGTQLADTDPGSLRRRFFRLTGLNILANLAVPLASLVDVAMLGHLDEIRFLAGVALAAVVFDLLYWTFGFLRMGTTGVTAQALGRSEPEEVFLTLYRGVAFAAAMGLLLWLLQGPLEELSFYLLSGEPGVESAGRDYFGARIWAAPVTLTNFALLGWFLGREESGRALAMTLTASLSNVVFNYVFIIRLGWAAFGAGVATVLSQVLMLAVALGMFFERPGRVAWTWRRVLERQRLGALFRLNRDILVRTFCLVGSFALFLNWSSVLGTGVLAANTLLQRLQTLAAYLIDGAAFATESLAGILRGAGEEEALRRLVRLAMVTGVAFALLFLLGLTLAPSLVLGLLTSHGDVVATARAFVPWLWPVLLFGASAFILDGLFLGLTAGRALRNAMVLSVVAGFLPAAWAAVELGSNHLLWASMALFMLARTGTLWYAGRAALGTRPAGGENPEAVEP